MNKTITIKEGQALDLSANAATPFRFKMTFGTDLLMILSKGTSEENLGSIGATVAQLAYVMNMQAKKRTDELSEDHFFEWLEQFDDPMTFTLKAKDIISFYYQNVKTSSKSKNSKGPATAK